MTSRVNSRSRLLGVGLLVLGGFAWAQTNTPQVPARQELVREACVQGRRYICGRVLQILPEGLVVESGYAELLNPPLNRSWVVRGQASLHRDAAAVEENRPDAVCIGAVFLTAFPKKPAVQLYDYVVLHAYPAGQLTYSPVTGVTNTVRRFSGSLEKAIELN